MSILVLRTVLFGLILARLSGLRLACALWLPSALGWCTRSRLSRCGIAPTLALRLVLHLRCPLRMRILSSSPSVACSVLALPSQPTILVPLRLGLALLVLLATLLRLSLCAFFKGLLLPRRLLLRPAILCERWLSSGLEQPGLSTEARCVHGRLRVVIRTVGLSRVPVVHRTIVDLLIEGRLRMELWALASAHRRSVAMATLVVAAEAPLRLSHGPAELSLRVWTMSLEVITSIIRALGLPLEPTMHLVAILCLSLLWVVRSVSVIRGLTVPLMRIVGVLVVLLEAV